MSARLFPFTTSSGPRRGPRLSPENTLEYHPETLRGDEAAAAIPNLYISSLARINSLKRGPFGEHSPILWDVAHSVPNWSKVRSGMLKMYAAECLGKFPVVQHFKFGGVGYVWPSESAGVPPKQASDTKPAARLAAGRFPAPAVDRMSRVSGDIARMPGTVRPSAHAGAAAGPLGRTSASQRIAGTRAMTSTQMAHRALAREKESG